MTKILQKPKNKGLKRGRKGKIIKDAEKPIERDLIKKHNTPTKKTKISGHSNIRCGKCVDESVTYDSVAKFKSHIALVHGGIARPFGESQEFLNEAELQVALKEAFSIRKGIQVPCFKCLGKKFTSFAGLKFHLLTCGKSTEQCNVSIHLV